MNMSVWLRRNEVILFIITERVHTVQRKKIKSYDQNKLSFKVSLITNEFSYSIATNAFIYQ